MTEAAPERINLSDQNIDRLIKAASGNAVALANLAHEMLARGRREQSISLVRQALALAPHDGNVRDLAARVLSTGVPSWHFDLVNDEVRNQAYDAALRRVCRPGVRVLDIGSGTGLLAMMAARAGASEVMTCEVNPPVAQAATEIVALNGFARQVRVIPKKSNDLDLDADLGGRVDVIVSEIVSNNLIGEAALPAMEDAVPRLLKPGGRVIPSHGEVRIALAHHAQPERGRMHVVDGFDVRPFNRLALPCRRVSVGEEHLSMRSEPATLFAFDFQGGGPYAGGKVSVPLASTGGPVNGIIQWIKLQLDEQGVYENRPAPGTASAWSAMFHQFDEEIEPAPGTIIPVHAVHGPTILRLWAGQQQPA